MKVGSVRSSVRGYRSTMQLPSESGYCTELNGMKFWEVRFSDCSDCGDSILTEVQTSQQGRVEFDNRVDRHQVVELLLGVRLLRLRTLSLSNRMGMSRMRMEGYVLASKSSDVAGHFSINPSTLCQ